MVWTVGQDSDISLDPMEEAGTFTVYHVGGNDNYGPGAVTHGNQKNFVRDVVALISGLDIKLNEVATNVNASWTAKNNTLEHNSYAGNSIYEVSTFEGGTEGWSGLTTTTLNGEKVGKFSGTTITKSLAGLNVSEYPMLGASLFYEPQPEILEARPTIYLNDYRTGLWAGVTEVSAETEVKLEGENSHKLYYTSSLQSEKYIEIGNSNLVLDDNDLMHFAINPYYIEAKEVTAQTLDEVGHKHTSQWWLQLEIDDGTGTTKYLRYFFTVETPVWYRGQKYLPDDGLGMIHDEYYNGFDWIKMDNEEGNIRWIPFNVISNYNQEQIGESTGTMEGTSRGDWTDITRNVLLDYGTAFGIPRGSIKITRIQTNGQFYTANEAWVLLDDLMFYNVKNDARTIKAKVTDGENEGLVFIGATTSDKINISNEGTRYIGEVWHSTTEDCMAILISSDTIIANIFDRQSDTTSRNTWTNLSGNVLEGAMALTAYIPGFDLNALIYEGNIEIYSTAGTETYIDNIVIAKDNEQTVYKDMDMTENTMGLSLHITDSYRSTDNGVKRIFDNSYYFSDYSTLVFAARVDDMGSEPEDLQFRVVVGQGTSRYGAYLSGNKVAAGTEYADLNGKFIPKQWVAYEIDLMTLRHKTSGDYPTYTTKFDTIEIYCGSTDFWLDNILLIGDKGTLLEENFEEIAYSSSYSNYEATTNIAWTPINVQSVKVALDNKSLDNSAFVVDVVHHSMIELVVTGESMTLDLTMESFAEDGTWLGTVTLLDNFVIESWDKISSTVVEVNSLGLNGSVRFLAHPRILNASGEINVELIHAFDDPNAASMSEDTDSGPSYTLGNSVFFTEHFSPTYTDRWQETTQTTVTNQIMKVTNDGTVAGRATPYFATESEKYEISFRVKLDGANDGFNFEFGEYTLVYSASSTSYLKFQDIILDSNSNNPISNTSFSVVKIWRNLNKVVIYINGEIFLVGVNSKARSKIESIFTWTAVESGSEFYIDNIVIDAANVEGMEDRFSSSNIVLDMPLHDGSGTTANDYSGNEIDGTIEGGAEWDAFGLVLDGSNDYIKVNNVRDKLNTNTDSFTLSLWLKTTATAGAIVGVNTSTGGNVMILNVNTDGKLRMYVESGTEENYITSTTINDGYWHNIAVAHNGVTNSTQIFVDGRVEQISHNGTSIGDSFTDEIILSSSSLWSIGQEYDLGPSTSDFLAGTIQEVVIADRVLERSEIIQIMMEGTSNIIPSKVTTEESKELIAYWDMGTQIRNLGDDTENYISDVSENDMLGSTTTATYTDFAECYYFDGDNDYVTIPHDSVQDPTDALTLSAWVYPEKSSEPYGVIIGNDHTSHISPYYYYQLRLDYDTATDRPKRIGFYLNINGTLRSYGYTLDYSNDDFVDRWHNITATYDLKTVKIYLDGENVLTDSTYQGTIQYNASTDIYIGKFKNLTSGDFKGYIRNVAVYGTALAHEEILYETGWGALVKTEDYEIYSPFKSTTQDSTIAIQFTDDFDTWDTPDPWSYGYSPDTASQTGSWSIGSVNDQLQIKTTARPSDEYVRYGVYQEVDISGDFDISVEIGRHDVSGTWHYRGSLRLLDENGEKIAEGAINDSWTSSAYKQYLRAYDSDGAYNADYNWNTGYIYSYTATVGFRIVREGSDLKLYRDTSSPYGDNWGTPLVIRSDAAAGRTVKKVILEMMASKTYWKSTYYHFDNFSIESEGDKLPSQLRISSTAEVLIEKGTEGNIFTLESEKGKKYGLNLTDLGNTKFYASLVPQDSLVAWYKFEDNYNDSSMYSNNIYNHQNPLFWNGRIGTGINTLGSTGCWAPDSSSLDMKTTSDAEVTVMAWINPQGTTSTEYNTIVTKQESYYMTMNTNYQVKFYTYQGDGSGSAYSVPTYQVAPNEWTHVVWTEYYDSANDRKVRTFYVNGEKEEVFYRTGEIGIKNTTGDLAIGRYDPTSARKFNGYIDEVRIYNVALGEQDIKNIYNETLQEYYYTGESPSKIVLPMVGGIEDISPYKHEFTASYPNTNYRQGTHFTGDHITLDGFNSSDFSTKNDYKISMWVYYDGTDISSRIPFGSGGTNYRLYAGVNASDYWALGVKDRSWSEASNTIKAYKDHWYYLEIINKVNDNLVDSTVELYVNGEKADSVTKPIFTPSYVPTIGCYYYGPTPEYQYPWLGFIRDFTFEYDNITPTKEPKFGTPYINVLESTYEINYRLLNDGTLRLTLGGTMHDIGTNIKYIKKITGDGVKLFGYGFDYTNTYSYNEKSQLVGEVTLFNPDNNVAGITEAGLSGIINKDSRLGLEIPYEPNTADGNYIKLLVTASVDCFDNDLYDDGKYKLVVEVEDGVKWEWILTNGSEIYADSIVNNKASTLVVSNAGTGGTLDKLRVYLETNSYAEDEVDVSIAVHSIETITKTGFNDSLDELVPQTITTNLSNEDQFAYYDPLRGCYTLENRGKFNPTNDEPASITIAIPESSPMHSLATYSVLSFDYLYTSTTGHDTVGIMLNMDIADYGGSVDIYYDLSNYGFIPADEYYTPAGIREITTWQHITIPLARLVSIAPETAYSKTLRAGDTLNSITLYHDDQSTYGDDRSIFALKNLLISNTSLGFVGLTGRKVGNREQSSFYAEEWLASPLYPRYDGTNETRLLPTNLIKNGGFEDETPVSYPSSDHPSWGYSDTGSAVITTETGYVRSGSKALLINEDTVVKQLIMAKANNQKLGFGFWYMFDSGDPLNWSAYKWGIKDSTFTNTVYEETMLDDIRLEWQYYYKEISLDTLTTSSFYVYWDTPVEDSGEEIGLWIDDVRLELIPNRYDMADTFRGFDPENITEYTFMDGWYELSRQNTTNYAILTDTTSQGDPSGYIQYYYAEFLSDSFFDGQIIVDCYSDYDEVTWYLWLNGSYRGVRYDSGSGSENFGSTDYIEFQPGINRVLLGKISHGTSSPTQFYINIKVPYDSGITMLTPKEKVARSPVVFNDINYDTEWVTREPTEGSPILDLDLTRPMEETSQVYIMRSADNSPYRNHANRNVCFYDEDGVEYYTSDNTHKTWLTIDDNTGGIGSSPYDDSADFDQDGGFTFGARFKTDGAVSTYSAIMTIRNWNCNGSSTMLRLWLNSDGDLHWYFRNDSGTASAGNVTGSNLDDSKWHQVIISKEAGTIGYTRVYIDGELRGMDDNPDGTYKYDIHNIDIGVDQYPWGSYRYPFKGNIKDVILLKREMTQSEVTQYMIKGTLYGRSIDNPKNLTSSILANLAYTGLRAYTVNAARLKFYVDTENKMFFTGDKTIWHPFGTVIMSQDVIPGILFGNGSGYADDYLDSRIEKFIDSGGKLVWAPGYFPFAKEGFYGEAPVTVNPLNRDYSYEGAWGHQAVFDIEESNDGRDWQTRSDYSDGMFTTGREDSYPATLSDTEPPTYGGRNNGSWINYDPYMTGDPSFSQLPHEGYIAHMILSNPEYQIDAMGSTYKVENADQDILHPGNPYPAPEPITSPDNEGLWERPYLVDYYGAMDSYYPYIWVESVPMHYVYERAIVGIGTVQGGTNAKGMVSVLPMFEWEENADNYLTGLNMGGGDYHKGKFEDRGKASITNSPTTTEMARRLMAEIFAANMITMTVDNIVINVCRDNDTIGTNFLDLENTQRISYGTYQPTDIGPLTISEGPSSGTIARWSMSQPIMGGDPGRAMANYEGSHSGWKSWIKMFYGEEDTIEELLIGSDGSKARDSIITMLSIDKDTDNKYSMFSVTLPKPNVRTEIEDKLITSVVPTKSLYEGNSRYYTIVENPSFYNNYNMGIGIDGGGTNYVTSMDLWNDPYVSNVPWSTYSEKISEYGRKTLQGKYGSSDREMIVRNNDLVRVDLADDTTNWYDLMDARYFMPIMPDAIQGEFYSPDLLDRVNIYTISPGSMNDGLASVCGSPTDWDNDGWWEGSSSTKVVEIVFTEVQDLSGVMLYLHAPNPLRVARVVLKDDNEEVILNRSYNLPAPIRVGGDKTKSSTIRNPQPMWMSLPEKIAVDVKTIEIYPVRTWIGNTQDDEGGLWTEVKVYGQGSNWSDGLGKPEIYLPQSVEFIERAPEIDTDPETTNLIDTNNVEYTIISNGDESYWGDGVNRYTSTSNQGGMMMVQIMHSANGEFAGSSNRIKSMRWNFGYTVPVNVVTGYPSRLDKTDYDEKQTEGILFIILTIILTITFVILLWWLPGKEYAYISTIANVIQKIQGLVMIIETGLGVIRVATSRDLGAFFDFQYREIIVGIAERLGIGVVGRVFTDWIVDLEGTAARWVAGGKYALYKGEWDDGRWWSFGDAADIMTSWNNVV